MSLKPPCPPEETARLGREIFQRVVTPHLKPEDKGKVVAIDVNTEAWIMDETAILASRRLSVDHANAHVWIERVGYSAYVRMGGKARQTMP